MDTFRQDLRYAARWLVVRPGFTSVAVLTLALGIGTTTAMFSVVRGILLRPLALPDSERLVTIWESAPESVRSIEGGLISHANARDVAAAVTGLGGLALVNEANLTVTGDDGAGLVRGARITPEFFDVLGVPLIAGRTFTTVEDTPGGPGVAIVGAEYALERFGRADAVGRTVEISGEMREIVGIARAGFDYPGGARIWVPARNDEQGCGRGCVNRGSVGRLAPGATVEGVRAELEPLALRLEAEYPVNAETRFAVASLRDVAVGDVRPALLLLMGAVVMVLLIACANVANLILVRGQGRVTEVALRSTLGASPARVVRQLMTESGLLALIGGLAGVGLAALSLDALLALAPPEIPRLDEVGLDLWALAFAGLLIVVTTSLFGAAPSFVLSRVDLSEALRGGGRGDVSGGRRARGRSLILTAQVALSVLLLTGTGLMVRSLVSTTRVEPGFDGSGMALFRLSLPTARYEPEARVLLMDRLLERLRAAPEIEAAAVMTGPPLTSVSVFGGFTRTDQPPPDPGEGPSAGYRTPGPGALELLRIPIVAGRAFDENDRPSSEPVVILTQRAAELYFPGEDPIGRTIDLQVSTGFEEDTPRTIVGIAGDVRGSSLTRAPRPETWIPYAQAGSGFPHVLMRGPDAAAVLRAARRELRAVDPGLPMMQAGAFEELVSAQLAQPRFYLFLLGLFAALAVVLAAVGMYGVVANAVSQRRREIGVRMALGARNRQVVRLVLLQGIVPALWGVALGILGTIWAGGAMRSLLYEVGPQDPLTLALVPVLLLVIVLLACAVPAARASRIPPSIALRAE